MRKDLLILAVAFGLLFSFQLGRAPLANPDEGRYAEIPREMIATGDWVTPRLDGVNYFEKPPLMYWAVAASLEIFGGSEGSARAALVVFGIAGVLLTYAAATRMCGRNAGIWSAVVLGTSALFMAHTHILILDLAVAVLMSAALFCFIMAIGEPPGRPRRLLFYGMYASAAAATLAKGLIGVLVTGAVMFLWLLIFNQWKRLRPLYLGSGIVLFLVIALPWHLLAAAGNPSWAHFYFIHEHWERFTTTEHGRQGPWWYFIPVIALGMFPWTGFLWPAIGGLKRGGRERPRVDAFFFVVWVGFVFLFFSASQSKLVPYVLPVFPPLAILIGGWLGRDQGADPRLFGRLAFGICAFSFLALLLAAAALIAVLKAGVIKDAAQASALRPYAFASAAILTAGAVAAPALMRRRVGAALACLPVTMAIFFCVLAMAQPDIAKPGTKELALRLKVLAQPEERVFSYHEFFDDFAYYAGRTVDVVAFKGELEPENDNPAAMADRFPGEEAFRKAWAGTGRVFAVARKKDVTELFADPSFRYHLLGETRDHYLFSNQP